MVSPEEPDLLQAARGGLAGIRELHRGGYGNPGACAQEAALAFPTDRIAQLLDSAGGAFGVAEIQDPASPASRPASASQIPARSWSILEQRYAEGLEGLASRIAVEGIEESLEGVPLGRFGKLLTVDRREIESYRSIRALAMEYSRQRSTSNPLSIAVFGAPGSGKSFGIVQVVESVLPGRIEVKTFNLSQFSRPAELHGAFHQVRDMALRGKLPLVFWDEFDTALEGRSLGWLRYFLAPMQDGSFQEGEVTHPIGRSLFVFAGGTADRLAHFGQQLSERELVEAKGPDFLSRLKGFVDVLGPNPSPSVQEDPHFVLRRAILLRALVAKHCPQILDGGREGRLRIDPGVARALLTTARYRHGARSMESILTMSQLSGKSTYERSSLPTEAQLALHVEARDFLSRVHRMALERDGAEDREDAAPLLEELAAAAHAVYTAGVRARGDQAEAAKSAYQELPEENKEANRALVRHIPRKLAEAGYLMVPARGDERREAFSAEMVESLAEQEHKRWMRAKAAGGWRYGPRRSEPERLHPALIFWGEPNEEEKRAAFTPEELSRIGPGPLSEKEREKDRDLVREIPRILAVAGYAMVRGEASR
jgi:hypothetical protein